MSNQSNEEENTKKASVQASNGLTGIPKPIQCCPTQNIGGSSNHELDDIAIEHFLDTLAEVALSIAARELAHKQKEERNS